jgi:Cu-Zn family superoxide dismutase
MVPKGSLLQEEGDVMSNRSYIDIGLPEMDLFLRQRRFKPVDVYYRRKPVKEWVYERKLPRHDNHFVRVYTSIQRYGRNRDSARDVGKDAIRVQVVYRDDKGETLVSMPKRVNRIATWKDNLNDRFEEIARTLPKVQFDRRGEPMTLRKKRGNLFWGSRDYPAYKETRSYGAEDTTVSRHQLIEDPDWLAGLESAIDSPTLLGKRIVIPFGDEWVEHLDRLMGRYQHGFLIDSGSHNNPDYLGAFVVLPMDPDNPLDWVLMEWDHIQSGGVDGIYDSKPIFNDYLEAIGVSPSPRYDVKPFTTSVWKHLSVRGTRYAQDSINQWSIGSMVTKSAESEGSRKGVAVMVHDGMSSMIYPKISGTVYFEETDGGVRVDYLIRGLYDGPHGFHIHEYGDLTDGCTSACAHFNPDNMTHGGLDTKIRHFGDLGNIESKDRLAQGSLFLPDGRLDSSKYGILGRMIIVHADRDDLGKGGDEESLKTGNAGKRLACGVIGLADPKTFGFEAETVEFEADDNYDATYGKKQAKIRRRLKNKIMKKNMMGTPANKWSARKSQELKRQYEAACERAGLRPYKGKKTSKQQDLSDWSKQGWRTASGKKSSVTGEPYFPAKAVAALKKKGLYAKAKRQKAKAIKEKRNARYSDDIREVVGQYRAENKNYKTCDNCGSKNHLYVLDEETVCVTCIESYEDNWEQIFGRRPDIRGLGA